MKFWTEGRILSLIIKGLELTFRRWENYGEEINSACCFVIPGDDNFFERQTLEHKILKIMCDTLLLLSGI